MNTPAFPTPPHAPRRPWMRRMNWLVAIAGLALAGAATAAPQLRTVEECLESGTRDVRLPDAAGGALAASPCPGCPTLRLQFDASTIFLVGKQQVPYRKFRELAAGRDLRLDVFYQPQTRILTRLRLPAVGNGQ